MLRAVGCFCLILAIGPSVTLGGDPIRPLIRFELQVELREIFRSLGKTVVMVTHDLGEAAFFADTILLMRDGRVVQHGSINDLTQRPEDPFVTRFIEAQRGHWQTGDGAS